jgi:hypothetical protein
MPISFEKYVRITSGVVGNRGARQRDLILRIFTPSELVSPGEALEFTDPNNIRDYFGIESGEYLRAQAYFAWVSKQATRAKKISFARYAPAGTETAIYGGTAAKSLSAILSSESGLLLTIGGTDYDTGFIGLEEAGTLADVADAVAQAVAALPGLENATAVYDAAARRFILSIPGIKAPIRCAYTELAESLGLTREAGAAYITGADAMSPAQTVSESAELSNNFGAFLFTDKLDADSAKAVAQWNDAQNVKFIYCLPAGDQAEAAALYEALKDYSGTAVTLSPVAGEYPEMAPAIILAATDYARRNSTCNYMFQQFALTPSVDKTSVSDALDKIRCNHYGVTQTAGQLLAFYQRGLLMGSASAPVDMNAYANEIWLKDYAGSQIMTLLLSLQKVSANARGRTQVIGILQPVIGQALYNGAVSVGKALTPAQKAFVTEETGDGEAWRQVQSLGYWLGCDIRQETTQDGRAEYYASYVLIYSKDDCIRKCEGSHELI